MMENKSFEGFFDEDEICNYCGESEDCTCEKDKCPICLEMILMKDLTSLSCSHKFCSDCLMGLTKSETKIQKFPPRCPCCRRGFKEKDVVGILPPHVYEVWDYLRNFSKVRKADDFFSCRTPNCRNGIIYGSQDERIWKCDKCQHQYCLKCKREGHTGDCDEYEMWLRHEELTPFTVRQLFQKGKLKRCPSCRIYTHRKGMSVDMACERCGSSWCWHCIRLKGLCRCRRRKLFRAGTKLIRTSNSIPKPDESSSRNADQNGRTIEVARPNWNNSPLMVEGRPLMTALPVGSPVDMGNVVNHFVEPMVNNGLNTTTTVIIQPPPPPPSSTTTTRTTTNNIRINHMIINPPLVEGMKVNWKSPTANQKKMYDSCMSNSSSTVPVNNNIRRRRRRRRNNVNINSNTRHSNNDGNSNSSGNYTVRDGTRTELVMNDNVMAQQHQTEGNTPVRELNSYLGKRTFRRDVYKKELEKLRSAMKKRKLNHQGSVVL